MKKGFAFHCHHDKLVEWVYDYDERVDSIKDTKPPKEQELRLKLFKLIPKDRVPAEITQARATYNKARATCNKARATYNKAWAACDKAWATYDKAWATYDKAWATYDKALQDCQPELEKLHAELCPECPWDGRTIFPER
jgi:hypothetical protein